MPAAALTDWHHRLAFSVGDFDLAHRLRPIAGFSESLANRADLALRDAIVNLGYRPGEALCKREICADLGAWRSPITEAIA